MYDLDSEHILDFEQFLAATGNWNKQQQQQQN